MESSQALHGHRDLHEGGEVANVEVVNAVDLPLGEKVLRNGQLSLQVFHCLLIFPCLKFSFAVSMCVNTCYSYSRTTHLITDKTYSIHMNTNAEEAKAQDETLQHRATGAGCKFNDVEF